MWKPMLAGAAALTIAGSSFLYAQQPGGHRDGERWRPSTEDMSAFTDARIAGLKAGLRLTPDQDKNWAPVEAAMRDLAKQRGERMAARANPTPPSNDPVERLRLRAEAMGQSAATLKRLADTAAPLYQSLDEGQKRRFVMLAKIGERRFNRWEHRQDREGGPRGFDQRGPRGPRPQ